MAPRIFGMVTTGVSNAYTVCALQSFFATTPLERDDEFVLVDNDLSFDDAHLPEAPITIVRNASPLTFAENANVLMQRAAANSADLFLLNNDLIFTPQWSDKITGADIVSPFSNAEAQYQVRGFVCKFAMDLADYLGNEDKLIEAAGAHRRRFEGMRTVFSFPFFCVRISQRAYQKIGEFDTRFGAGGAEDKDYCVRAHIAGMSVAYAAASYVLHFQGKSTWRGGEKPEETKARDETYIKAFSQKWGERLTRLFIFGDYRVLEECGCAAQAREGRFAEVILSLKDGQ